MVSVITYSTQVSLSEMHTEISVYCICPLYNVCQIAETIHCCLLIRKPQIEDTLEQKLKVEISSPNLVLSSSFI